jgi:hypothetical protein
MIISLSLVAEKAVIRLSNFEPNQRQEIINNYDVLGFSDLKSIDIVFDNDNLAELNKFNCNVEVMKTETEIKAGMQASDRLAGYRDYEEVLTLLQQYQTDNPEICKLYDLGDTWGKMYYEAGNDYYEQYDHEVWGLKVSDNPEQVEDEPSFYFMGVHHSREPISAEVVIYFLEDLIAKYNNNDADAVDHVNNKQLWFIPLVNPNGHKVVTNEDDVWWRKNIRDNNENGSFDTDYDNGNGDDGVDPNRNYGYVWGNVGSTDDPSGITYHGPNEFSEPETQAMKALVESEHFVGGFSYHSYGEWVLVPYGYAENVNAPDHDALFALGLDIAESIDGASGGHYTAQNSWELYPTMGGTDDWAYGEHGVFAYTVELAEEFIPSADEVLPICEANLDAPYILLNRIESSLITGHITDNDNNPLEAEIYIEEIDNHPTPREPFQSNETFGTYYRIVEAGTYNVTYSAYGYNSITETIVVSDQPIVFDVTLTPANSVSFSAEIRNQDDVALVNMGLVFQNTPLDTLYSDANGMINVENIPVAEYDVYLFDPNGELSSYSQTIDLNEDTSYQFVMFEPIFTEDFESGLGNWSVTGSWQLTTDEAFEGQYSLTDSDGSYNSDQNTTATLNETFDFSNAESVSIQFKAKYDIESDYDFAYFQYSDGGTWNDLLSFTGSSDWDTFVCQLPDTESDISFRFKFYSDTYVEEDGIYIDDIKIYAVTTVEQSNDDNIVSARPLSINNYPNPFNPTTKISFNIPEKGMTNVSVYNIKGQKVNELVNETLDAGDHSVIWNGTDKKGNNSGSGLYLFKLSSGGKTAVQKSILLK